MRSRANLPLQAAVGLMITLLSAGCAAMAPKAERYVAPPLGTTWVTARLDTGSFGSGSSQVASKRGERSWQGREVISFESSDTTTLALPNGDWVAQVRGETPVVTWNPAAGWDWPLEVGKTWTKKYTVTNHTTKQAIPYEVTQKVEAYEDVTVPAGTFKAFKISSSDTLGNDNVNWFSPELGIFVKLNLKRNAKHPAGPGTRNTELVSQTIRK